MTRRTEPAPATGNAQGPAALAEAVRLLAELGRLTPALGQLEDQLTAIRARGDGGGVRELDLLLGPGLLTYAMAHQPRGRTATQLNLRSDVAIADSLADLSTRTGISMNKAGNALLRAALIDLGALDPHHAL